MKGNSMKFNKKIFCLFGILAFLITSLSFSEDMDSLINKGKAAIEAGKYKEASDYLAEILIASPNNETKNPGAIALSSTTLILQTCYVTFIKINEL